VDAIQELAKDNRLYLITARTPDEIGRAAEYLETFDLRKHFTELHSTLDKPATCAALRVDTLIDDRRTHLRKQDVCFVPHMPDELFADDVSHMNAWEHAPKYVGGKHATD
jgi:diadenosine tetraphosphatase ApaH/serine/threonine PP2A family protein phosphatase